MWFLADFTVHYNHMNYNPDFHIIQMETVVLNILIQLNLKNSSKYFLLINLSCQKHNRHPDVNNPWIPLYCLPPLTTQFYNKFTLINWQLWKISIRWILPTTKLCQQGFHKFLITIFQSVKHFTVNTSTPSSKSSMISWTIGFVHRFRPTIGSQNHKRNCLWMETLHQPKLGEKAAACDVHSLESIRLLVNTC